MGQYQDAYNEFKDYYQKTDDPEGRTEAMLEIKGLEFSILSMKMLRWNLNLWVIQLIRVLVFMDCKKGQQMILFILVHSTHQKK